MTDSPGAGLDSAAERALREALGDELRGARRRKGWSLRVLAGPSSSWPNTISRYELGERMVPMTTFVDLCVRLGEDPTVLLRRALQRAGIAPDKMTLEVDLLALLRDEFDPLFLHPWAKGRLSESRGGLIQLSPEDVKSLARDFHPRHTVAGYLARYYPTGTARN